MKQPGMKDNKCHRSSGCLLFGVLLTTSNALAESPPNTSVHEGVPAYSVAPHETGVNLPALRRAIEDLAHTYSGSYADGNRYLSRLVELEAAAAAKKDIRHEFIALQREALLANPLLDFPNLLLIKRPANAPSLGLPRNWESNCSVPGDGYDDGWS
jgi:hypothetical protein